MEVKKTSGNLSKMAIYEMTKSPEIQKLSSVEGQILEITDWIIYEDVDSDGEAREIFSCRTKEGETMASNSPTVVRTFNDILDCFEPEEISKIKVVGRKSGNGRTFYTVTYVG